MLFVQENIPLEEVFENLRCTKDGLTSDAAQERLAIFGHNKLEEKKVATFGIQPFFPTPLSWVTVLQLVGLLNLSMDSGANILTSLALRFATSVVIFRCFFTLCSSVLLMFESF